MVMGKQGSTSGKRQREADKQAKAKAKRERRLQAKPESGPGAQESPGVTPSVVLGLLEETHRRFEAAEISFEEYDEAKAALLRQLHVD